MSAIQDLFKHHVHIGHKTEKWNPKVKPFLHGSKNKVHVFNLESTVNALEDAKKFLASVKLKNGKVLVVGTKPQASFVLNQLMEGGKQHFVDQKWAPGLLTNFKELRKRIDHYLNLKGQFGSGEINKYTKKEIAKFKKDLEKLHISFHGVAEMRTKPEALIVLDAVGNRLAIEEARKCNIPVVAVIDSNADPDGIMYPIPGNDDSVKSLQYLLKALLGSL